MYAAVDIGGTKTLIAVFTDKGKLTEQYKFPTPAQYEDFIIKLTENVANISTTSFKRVVIAVPGKINRAEGIGVAFGNLTWTNIPIGPDCEKIFNTPVLIENDAKLAALSEAQLLKNKYRKVLYVTISTGIGGGLIIDGKIPPDFQDIEVGQMLLEYQGKLTDWEDFGSGRAFQTKFGKRVGDMPDSDLEAWRWFAHNIAVGLIDLMATLTPEVIVLGGGAGAHLEKFQRQLKTQLKNYENPLFSLPPIIKAKRAEEAVIYGCYELAKEHHGQLTRST
ncbi:MAG: N-acetylglucosamine kinase [Candidatus Saccharimonadales bacterium]